MAAIASANGLIALLDEQEPQLQCFALDKLNIFVDQFWAEVADDVSKIEILYENESFPQRELAALVASKVYYHLGEYEESLQFALRAGNLFDLAAKNEFVETIISNCIDKYINQSTTEETVDKKLLNIVERMFKKCFADKEWKQAIGIALESQRLDVIAHCFTESKDEKLISYVLDVSTTIIQNHSFRKKVLQLLVDTILNQPSPDYLLVARCLVLLQDSSSPAKLLTDLVNKNDTYSLLIAYQIAFDTEASATQEYLQKISSQLPDESHPWRNIKSILSGEQLINLNLEFLCRNNNADMLILTKTKDSLEGRNSIFHSAVTFANAFMNAGTTSDGFFRHNLEWLGKASNWSKFSATAALGVIHKGHLNQGLTLLAPYLPQPGQSTSPYSEGGSLYALGLIYANHGSGVLETLREQFKATGDEVIQHGAALGLGVAGMATGNDEIYEDLKGILYGDNAVSGEATGLAMGLIMLGTANEKALDEMLQYAKETQHEKIIRGLALGIALLMYGKEEAADALIEQLCGEADPILRYGGIYTIALAYAGTGNNKAIRQLLHVAVSDANDDVRRVAVMALGFLLFRNPTVVPRVVQLLSVSYNPHVRYGAALALGIACAGSGLSEAIELLEPMTKDATDFVRQGAYISMAMILIEQNELYNPKVATARKHFEKVIGEKHEEAVAKFGAALAQGIIDAGGRNVQIGLSSCGGNLNLNAIVGMAIFSQYWYWFPLTHFLSLAFTPTSIIALNKDLKAPQLKYVSNSRPWMFAYPAPTTPPSKDKVEVVPTAVLSTTARAKARAKKHEKEKVGDAMDTDKVNTGGNVEDKMDTDEPCDIPTDLRKLRSNIATFEVLENMRRVLPVQLPKISFYETGRYQPVKKPTGGVVMVHDTKPGDPEELIELKAHTDTAQAAPVNQEDEAKPPEPFEYPDSE